MRLLVRPAIRKRDRRRLFHKREQLSLPRTSARLCWDAFRFTARRELDGWCAHSKEKITLPGSVHTVIDIVCKVLPLQFPMVSCRNVKPALLSAN